MRLLAVDPGGTNGFVVVERAADDTVTVLAWGEIRGVVAFLNRSWHVLTEVGVDVVVVERWVTLRGRAFTHEPDAAEVIGGLRWQSAYNGVRFWVQGAADAAAWGTPDRLAPFRESGVGRGGGGHALSALRHALLYLATRGRWDDDSDGDAGRGEPGAGAGPP